MTSPARLQLIFDFLVRGQGDLNAARQAIAGIKSEAERARPAVDSIKRSLGLTGSGASAGLIGIQGANNSAKNINDLRREVAERQRVNDQIRLLTNRFGQAKSASDNFFQSTFSGLTRSFVAANLLTDAIRRGAVALKDFTVGSALIAAEANLSGLAGRELARINNQGVIQIANIERRLQSLGISIRQSREAIARVLPSDIPISRLPALADLARNASVIIPGETTSETLSALVSSVIGREVEPLRRRGLNVNFESALQQAARSSGRTANDFSETEKTAIALEHVLSLLIRTTGLYDASLTSVGKRLTTLPRLVDDLKVKFGQEFQEDLGRTIKLTSDLVLGLQDIVDKIGLLKRIQTEPLAAGTLLALAQQFGIVRAGSPVISAGVRQSVADTTSIIKGEADRKAADTLNRVLAKRLELEKEIEKALQRVVSLEDQESTRGLTGIQRLNAERAIALRDLGKTAELTERINDTFDARRGRETREQIDSLRSGAAKDARQVVNELGLGQFEGVTPAERAAFQTKQFQERLQKTISDEDTAVGKAEQQIERFKADSIRSRVNLIRNEVQARERIIEITTDDIALSRRVYDLRVRAAERVFQITRDDFELNESLAAARLDAEVKVAELRRKQIDDFRNSAGQVFDALIASGATGFGDFLRAQALTVARTISQNVAEELFRSSRGRSTLPGQTTTDAQGNPKLTGLGRVLKGTPLGVDPAKFAVDLNTLATNSNTVALSRLSADLQLVRVAGGGLGGGVLGDLPLGNSTSDRIGKILGQIPGLEKSTDASTDAATAAKDVSKGLNKFLDIAVPLGLGGFGVFQGIKQGGTGGKLTAIGGALTAASAIPGPQQPFVAAGGQILSLAGGLFGPNQKDRQQEIQDELDRRRFTPPEERNREFSVFGGESDLNFFRGQPRIIEVNRTINLNVSALDARSIMDRGPEIADSFNQQLLLGHNVIDTITERWVGA